MKKQTDIALLLMILLMLSASIGILHGRKKTIDTAVTANEARAILEYQDALDYIQPYLISGNVDLVAATLPQIDSSLFERIIDAILNDETVHLTDEQKIQMLAAIFLHDSDIEKQKIIFDRMVKKFPQYPLFIPLITRYKKAIPLIKQLAHQMNKAQFATWSDRSLDEAIDKNDAQMLAGLVEAGIPIDAKKASSLLFRVASENKKPAFVPILVQMKADIHYTPDGKYTVLMKAVERNNAGVVKALIEQGALPDQILDPKIGSARQIAFERGYAGIELILKKIDD